MLDVRRMRVLREVARRGSFSAAADALAYTQSAVSQQIAALEREAGTRLVERNARGVRLTDAGRALVAPPPAVSAPGIRPARSSTTRRLPPPGWGTRKRSWRGSPGGAAPACASRPS